MVFDQGRARIAWDTHPHVRWFVRKAARAASSEGNQIVQLHRLERTYAQKGGPSSDVLGPRLESFTTRLLFTAPPDHLTICQPDDAVRPLPDDAVRPLRCLPAVQAWFDPRNVSLLRDEIRALLMELMLAQEAGKQDETLLAAMLVKASEYRAKPKRCARHGTAQRSSVRRAWSTGLSQQSLVRRA